MLLDAENLKLDINRKTFLTSLSKYPLQVKIAFANWRNLASGKQYGELYGRGYQLVHVPGGKRSVFLFYDSIEWLKKSLSALVMVF